MILLLDTTVLIDSLRNHKGRRGLLADLVNAGHTLAVATINIAEVYAGVRKGEEFRTEALLVRLKPYELDAAIARRAGSLKNTYSRVGVTLGIVDSVVAATALEHGLTLMTDNRRDFPQPELKLYDLP